MKIGMLLPAPFALGNPYNGVREQALSQARALESLGHEVVRLDPWVKTPPESLDIVHLFEGGFAFHRIEHRSQGLVKRRVLAPMIDSVQSNRAYRLLERLGRLHERWPTLQRLYADQAAASEAVIARSEWDRRRFVDGLGIEDRKVHVVLNGCDAAADADPELARRAFGLPCDFVLHISRWSQPRKNVLSLVRAAERAGLPLVIAGTAEPGPVARSIEQAVARSSNARLIGQLDDNMRQSLYAACRVFALPSLIEGTGLVALEAAAQGAAVVITSVGGPPDYFGELADYVADPSAPSIALALRRAWDRTRSGELRLHVRNSLDWKDSASSLVAVYRELPSRQDGTLMAAETAAASD